MKHKQLLRIISFILAFVMVLELGATQVYATDMEYTEDTRTIPLPEITAPEPVAEIPQVYIDGEVSELRSEYEKHYRLTDGSYMAVQYPVAVHYEEDGHWVDIDNTLEATTMFSGETVYQAVNGDSVQAFAAALTDGTIMTMAQGERVLAMSIWTGDAADEDSDAEDSEETLADDSSDKAPIATEEPVHDDITDDESENATDTVSDDAPEDSSDVTTDDADASESDFEVSDNAESAETAETVPASDGNGIFGLATGDENAPGENTDDSDERVIVAHVLSDGGAAAADLNEEDDTLWALDDVMPDELSASILYEDVFPGVDLRYDTFSYNVKESIILKQQMDQDEYVYSFLLTLDGLEPVLHEDGRVDLLDENYEVKFTIPTPYMWDANDVYSDAVYYELEETADGWVLSVQTRSGWKMMFAPILLSSILPTMFLLLIWIMLLQLRRRLLPVLLL